MGDAAVRLERLREVKLECATDPYAMETKRLLDVLDRRMAETVYVAGDAYTIAHMAIFPR